MAHPTTPAWPNIPTTSCARGPAAFQHAPRPNLSFTVLGGSMAAQQVLPGLPYWSSPAAQPIFAGPPPTVAGAVPIVAGPTPIVAGPPPIDSGLAARLQVGAEARDDSVDGYVMASVMWFFVQIESFCFRGRLVPSEPLGGVLFEQVCHLELQQVPPRPCRPWRARASRHRPGASRPGASRPILGGDQSWSVGQHQ